VGVPLRVVNSNIFESDVGADTKICVITQCALFGEFELRLSLPSVSIMALNTVLADHCYCRTTEDPNFGNCENPMQLEIRRSNRQKERKLLNHGLTPIRHFDEYDSTKLAPCRIARWTSLFAPHRRRKKEKPSRKRREVFFSKRPGTDEDSSDDSNSNSPKVPPPKPPSAAEAMKRLLHVRMNLIFKAQQETLRLWQLIQQENLEKLRKSSGIECQLSPAPLAIGAKSQVQQPTRLDANTCNQRVKEIFDLIDPLLLNTGYKPDTSAAKKIEHVTPNALKHHGALNVPHLNGASNVQHSSTSNVVLGNAASNVSQCSDALYLSQRSDALNLPQHASTVKRSGQEVKFQLRNPSSVLNNALHLVKKDTTLTQSETEYVMSKQGTAVHCDTEHVKTKHGGDKVEEYDTMENSETEQLTPVHSGTEFVMKHRRKRRHKKVTRAHVPGSRQFCVSHDFSIVYTTVSPIW